MKTLRTCLLRIAGLFSKTRRDRELSNEIESHLQLHIDDNLRAGMSPEVARRDAPLKLGGIEPLKEAGRDRRSVPLVENLLRDVRFALQANSNRRLDREHQRRSSRYGQSAGSVFPVQPDAGELFHSGCTHLASRGVASTVD